MDETKGRQPPRKPGDPKETTKAGSPRERTVSHMRKILAAVALTGAGAALAYYYWRSAVVCDPMPPPIDRHRDPGEGKVPDRDQGHPPVCDPMPHPIPSAGGEAKPDRRSDAGPAPLQYVQAGQSDMQPVDPVPSPDDPPTPDPRPTARSGRRRPPPIVCDPMPPPTRSPRPDPRLPQPWVAHDPPPPPTDLPTPFPSVPASASPGPGSNPSTSPTTSPSPTVDDARQYGPWWGHLRWTAIWRWFRGREVVQLRFIRERRPDGPEFSFSTISLKGGTVTSKEEEPDGALVVIVTPDSGASSLEVVLDFEGGAPAKTARFRLDVGPDRTRAGWIPVELMK